MAFGDMMDMMKKAKELQGKMEQLQAEVSAIEVAGSSGGGLVSVVMTGKSEMKRVTIDPSLLKPEEAEIVEDLIVAAVNDARAKAEDALADKMRELTGGLQLPPGMKLPFGLCEGGENDAPSPRRPKARWRSPRSAALSHQGRGAYVAPDRHPVDSADVETNRHRERDPLSLGGRGLRRL